MRLGTRPGPRTASISVKISRTRPRASPGSTRRIRAMPPPRSGRPRERTVVAVLAPVVPAPAVVAVLAPPAGGHRHHAAGHVLEILQPHLRCPVGADDRLHFHVHDVGNLHPAPSPVDSVEDRRHPRLAPFT